MDKPFFHLTFGRPESPEEAWYRLPAMSHPLYDTDQEIEHLANLKEWFAETYMHILKNEWNRLENRFAPLTMEDMAFMRHISFAPGKPLVQADWKHLPEDLSPWNRLLPTGDDKYRWWEVCPMEPQPQLPPGIKFVSIETNNRFVMKHTYHRFNSGSEFEVGWTDTEELDKLVNILR